MQNNTDGDCGLGIGDWGLGIGPNPQYININLNNKKLFFITKFFININYIKLIKFKFVYL